MDLHPNATTRAHACTEDFEFRHQERSQTLPVVCHCSERRISDPLDPSWLARYCRTRPRPRRAIPSSVASPRHLSLTTQTTAMIDKGPTLTALSVLPCVTASSSGRGNPAKSAGRSPGAECFLCSFLCCCWSSSAGPKVSERTAPC